MSAQDRRLILIRHPGRQVMATAAGGLVGPLLIALPCVGFLVAPLVWVFADFSAAWRTAAWLAGGLLVLGLPVMVLMSWEELRAVRWIEADPARVMLRRIRGTDRVAVADLRRVRVVEKLKLGRATGGEVILETATGPAVRFAVGPGVRLTDWFAARLGPAEVEVRRETELLKARLTIEHWYQAPQVAALWQVPVGEVAALARRLRVRTETFTPRVGALHGANPELTVYDPDDVHAAAPAVPQARTAAE